MNEDCHVETVGNRLELHVSWVGPPDAWAALEEEAAEHRRAPIRGTLGVVATRWDAATGRRVLELPRPSGPVTRLDLVIEALRREGMGLGPRLATHVVASLVPVAERLRSRDREFPFERLRAILVHPTGALATLGAGLPATQAWLTGEGPTRPHHRALQALLLRLLSGVDPSDPLPGWREMNLPEPPEAARRMLAASSWPDFLAAVPETDPDVSARWARVIDSYTLSTDHLLADPPAARPTPAPKRAPGPMAPVDVGSARPAPEPAPPPPVRVPSSTMEATSTRPVSRSTSAAPRPPARRSWAAAAAGLVLVAGAGAYLWMASASTEPASESVNSGTETPPARPEVATPPAREAADAPARKRPLRDRTARASAPRRSSEMSLISVVSQPSGASVEIDGGFVGTTPLVLPHALEDREYRVKVLKDGYAPWEQKVRPDPEKGSMSVMATLDAE